MHISDVSMHRKPEVLRMGSTEQLHMAIAMPWEVLWRAEWASPVATATTVQNQTPKQGLNFR